MLSIFNNKDTEKLEYHEFDSILFKCVIIENHIRSYSPSMLNNNSFNYGGYGNGYVCLPNYHPLFETQYYDININPTKNLNNIQYHINLTYSELSKNENLWVIGFSTIEYHLNRNNCSFEIVKDITLNLEKQCVNYEPFKKMYRKMKILDIFK
jgi:hypothetical protein